MSTEKIRFCIVFVLLSPGVIARRFDRIDCKRFYCISKRKIAGMTKKMHDGLTVYCMGARGGLSQFSGLLCLIVFLDVVTLKKNKSVTYIVTVNYIWRDWNLIVQSDNRTIGARRETRRKPLASCNAAQLQSDNKCNRTIAAWRDATGLQSDNKCNRLAPGSSLPIALILLLLPRPCSYCLACAAIA